MKVSDAFPSKWLSASDLDGRNVKVVIDRVGMETIGQGEDPKPVVYFKGGKKGLVLNKTNAKKIAAEYGDDTDEWIGCEIVLFSIMTDFQGQAVQAIRVRRPTAKDDAPAARKPAPAQDLPDDEIPF